MEKDQQNALLLALKNVPIPVKKSKTDFLENSKIIKIIASKIEQGATVKSIHEVILNTGYKLSFSDFQKWMNIKYPKN
jgi:hypothetical protein